MDRRRRWLGFLTQRAWHSHNFEPNGYERRAVSEKSSSLWAFIRLLVPFRSRLFMPFSLVGDELGAAAHLRKPTCDWTCDVRSTSAFLRISDFKTYTPYVRFVPTADFSYKLIANLTCVILLSGSVISK
jgi:hypothetical protein